MKTEKVLGINVISIDYKNLEEKIENDIKNNQKSFIVAINPEKIIKAQKDAQLYNILNNSTYPIPDGIGIIYASKHKQGKIKSRITGIDTMKLLCELSEQKKYKIFLYGATNETIQLAKERLEEKYVNINIVGHIDGYEKDNEKIISTINKTQPDIVFVALGSPKQEYWIYNNMDKIDAKIFQGVGGSFDVISGKVKRAPKIMQKLGLEWLYRLVKNPKRIFRQLNLIKFVFLVLLNKKNN